MTDQERYIDVWNNCLRIIENIIEPQQFNTWFKPIRPVSFDQATLTVEVPSDFFREYLESAYLDVIRMTLKRVIGSDARLVYLIKVVRNQPSIKVPQQLVGTPTNRPMNVSAANPGENPGPFVYPGLHKIQVNPRLNPVYNFANLVEGECNKMGITAARNIAVAPGKTPFNPLFIFGGPGLGKTHLAQAVGIAEDAAAKGMVGVEEAFEVIIDEFGRRIVVALDLVDDHFALFLKLGLWVGAVENDVGKEREGSTEMLPREGGVVDNLLLARVGVEVAAYALHAVVDVPRVASGRAFEEYVLYEMSHSALVRLLVARAGSHGDACVDDAG